MSWNPIHFIIQLTVTELAYYYGIAMPQWLFHLIFEGVQPSFFGLVAKMLFLFTFNFKYDR
ncbi:hypothetical protein AAKU61_003813 [Undibacterium sp. GrIS 1.2]